MATLQEIRKKLQQSKQQADVVLTPTQTKAKLKRLKEQLARLKKGEDMLILPFCKVVRNRNVMQPWPAAV